MRLWSKQLISVLPRQQLLGQWRECCLIAKNISENGTPNHILVNRIMDYPIEHFYAYACLIKDEMENRRYKCDFNKFSKWIDIDENHNPIKIEDLFKDWHNNEYIQICYWNLKEKFLCGGITEEEWIKIDNEFYIIGSCPFYSCLEKIY